MVRKCQCKFSFASKKMSFIKKYWRNENYCDVTLICEEDGTRIMAHRLVLAASSAYFDTMFSGPFKEAKEPEVTIKEVPGNILQTLVNYSYTGKIDNLNAELAEKLLPQASLMLYNEVVKTCEELLIKQINQSNCFNLISLAKLHNCTDLLKAANNYKKKHFSDVIQNDKFLKMNAEELTKFLDFAQTDLSLDKSIFKAIIQWYNFNKEERENHLLNLLSFVKFQELDNEFILGEVIEAIGDKKECVRLIFKSKMPAQKRFIIAVNNNVYIYNLINKSVEHKYSIETEYLENRLAIVGDSLILVGLNKFSRGAKSLNLKTGLWTDLPQTLFNRHWCSLAVLNDKELYAIGSLNSAGAKSIERFDSTKNKWTKMECELYEKYALSTAVLKGKIYAIGGYNKYHYVTNKVECFDPVKNEVKACANMLERRQLPSVVATNNNLYVFGGFYEENYVKSIEKYDPVSNTWIKVGELQSEYSELSTCFFDDKIIVVGHKKQNNKLTLEEFDPITHKFKHLAYLPIYLRATSLGSLLVSTFS